MTPAKKLVVRLVLALAFGAALMGVTLPMAFQSIRYAIQYPQNQTRRMLLKTDRVLADYRAKTGVYPPTLEAAGLGYWFDGWERPFLYSLSGGVPLVESLGRDGVRGGVGLDADLSNQNPTPPESQLTPGQLLFDANARPLWTALLLSFALGAVLVFVGSKDETFERKSWPRLFVSLVATFILAAVGALFIAIAHIPSGH